MNSNKLIILLFFLTTFIFPAPLLLNVENDPMIDEFEIWKKDNEREHEWHYWNEKIWPQQFNYR